MVAVSRREFLAYSGATAAALALTGPRIAQAAAAPFTLAPLPYSDSALAPVISQTTIGFHYGKHHQGYVNNLNSLLAQAAYAPFAGLSLPQIVRASANRARYTGLFNNAAQSFNHEFYWNSLKPGGGDASPPTGSVLDLINTAFGDYATFKTKLRDAAVGQFGNGWAWLVEDKGALKIVTTSNADTPLLRGQKPLLTIDVWEHAYYLDYQNLRKNHVEAVIAQLLDWGRVEQRLAGA